MMSPGYYPKAAVTRFFSGGDYTVKFLACASTLFFCIMHVMWAALFATATAVAVLEVNAMPAICYHSCDSPPLNKCWHFCDSSLDLSMVQLLEETAKSHRAMDEWHNQEVEEGPHEQDNIDIR